MKAKDIDEVRRQAYEAGRRDGLRVGRSQGHREMREWATCSLYAAGGVRYLSSVAFLEGPDVTWRTAVRRAIRRLWGMG